MGKNAEARGPMEYRTIVTKIYKKVKCVVRKGGEQFDFLSSDIGVKHGCPLSPTLFILCIDELEEMVQPFTNDEGINCLVVAQDTILLLMYTYDVVLVAQTKEESNRLMRVLEDS